MHDKYFDDFRNSVTELDRDSKEMYENKDNEKAIQIQKKMMLQSLKDRLVEYVDSIAEHLSKYCEEEISVCIKVVNFERANSDNPLATTFARSSNTRKDRVKDDESVEILRCTDFEHLYSGRNHFYGKSDLLEEHRLGRYKVPEPIQNWSDKYQSTLIAPIRYFRTKSRHNNDFDIEFEILAFLCIDAKGKMENWENPDSYELSYMAIYADSLYIYLKKFKEIYCMCDIVGENNGK